MSEHEIFHLISIERTRWQGGPMRWPASGSGRTTDGPPSLLLSVLTDDAQTPADGKGQFLVADGGLAGHITALIVVAYHNAGGQGHDHVTHGGIGRGGGVKILPMLGMRLEERMVRSTTAAPCRCRRGPHVSRSGNRTLGGGRAAPSTGGRRSGQSRLLQLGGPKRRNIIDVDGSVRPVQRRAVLVALAVHGRLGLVAFLHQPLMRQGRSGAQTDLVVGPVVLHVDRGISIPLQTANVDLQSVHGGIGSTKEVDAAPTAEGVGRHACGSRGTSILTDIVYRDVIHLEMSAALGKLEFVGRCGIVRISNLSTAVQGGYVARSA